MIHERKALRMMSNAALLSVSPFFCANPMHCSAKSPVFKAHLSREASAMVVGYMLLRWRLDCSPDHRRKDERYRLWLSDPLVLYGVENAKLAPGYQAPTAKTHPYGGKA